MRRSMMFDSDDSDEELSSFPSFLVNDSSFLGKTHAEHLNVTISPTVWRSLSLFPPGISVLDTTTEPTENRKSKICVAEASSQDPPMAANKVLAMSQESRLSESFGGLDMLEKPSAPLTSEKRQAGTPRSATTGSRMRFSRVLDHQREINESGKKDKKEAEDVNDKSKVLSEMENKLNGTVAALKMELQELKDELKAQRLIQKQTCKTMEETKRQLSNEIHILRSQLKHVQDKSMIQEPPRQMIQFFTSLF
ncbi:hypothetical protein GUITHDRAFT_146079 [Guillardia theta CCMP2712]|uniref:Uncharacterized protein n=1 Tax=Guillardia theta (strain CCMP2712) TaxID=905079 RepID=L1IJQ4_GUITC|nr:hypothetical protein GUITHDRAFT_146079 [Guillardia theta CCMP2712]EKX36040.1 hypothetical protein GUITHDRAFT_146079 [Guillardia theta CCMP2712]|eukprot:XP_005823020.1 hypothetical protein GUITHDRAFT_146079 [Guillardia theta CCMP2712]